MKVFKGLLLSFLGLLLFLSLSIFGIMFTLNSTLLNPDFVVSEVNRVDMPSLTRELTEKLIIKQLPQETQFLEEAIYNAIPALEPWIREQLRAGINSGYDYFLGRSQRLSLVIPLEPLKTDLRDKLRQAFMQSPSAQLPGLSPAQVEQYFNQFYQEFSKQIPASFELNESLLSPEVLAQIRQVKQYIGYFQLGYKALIGFMVLLILGIILLNRRVRSITRELGINFLIYGALEYAGIFLAKYVAPTSLPLPEMPRAIQTWLPQLFVDFLAPLEIFSLALVASGIALIIVSFVYKPRPVEL